MNIDFFADLKSNVEAALSEDIGDADITAQLISEAANASADIITRETAVICGVAWVDEVMSQVDPKIDVQWQVKDGDKVVADQLLYRLSGPSRSLLTAERPALNFLQTLSGTATRTHSYSQLIAHTETILLDTRKTIPGLRRAQKYAVKCGGGGNHRMGLYDAFLIKENHIMACGSISKAIASARALYPERRIEIEVESFEEYLEALNGKPNWIMLDNFSLDNMRKAVDIKPNDIKLEASGGIETDNELIAIAETGVDYISSGSLTKHCRAIDLSMRFNN